MALDAYYRCPAVGDRIREYCGAEPGHRAPTTWAIAGYGGARRLTEGDGAPIPCESTRQLPDLFGEGADVCRSLGDDGGSLALLDVDYVNSRDPAEPYQEPELCFERLEPVYRTLEALFAEYGLEPLTLVTGRGYHFVGQVPLGSPSHRKLEALGAVGPPLRAKYETLPEESRAFARGRAHDGVGRLLEYLCHRAVERLRGRTEIPVELADLPPRGGGPFICLDLSAYADPFNVRFSRCAFSFNQKAYVTGLSSERSIVVCVPRREGSPPDALHTRASFEEAAELAREVDVRIPRFSGRGLSRWLRDYRKSTLAAFHRDFDSGRHDEPSEWPRTYDRLPLPALPRAVRDPLETPNPNLLRPADIRAVALHLWREGWHPRAVAGLLRSKFERDFGWGNYWLRYDAGARADFYVRLLCGTAIPGAPRQVWTRRFETGRAA